MENPLNTTNFSSSMGKIRFLDRYFIFSAKTRILSKWASRRAFQGSEREKISIFSKCFKITIKTVLRPLFSQIYVSLVHIWSKYHFIGENDRWLGARHWIFTLDCPFGRVSGGFGGLKKSIFPKLSDITVRAVLREFFPQISVFGVKWHRQIHFARLENYKRPFKHSKRGEKLPF